MKKKNKIKKQLEEDASVVLEPQENLPQEDAVPAESSDAEAKASEQPQTENDGEEAPKEEKQTEIIKTYRKNPWSVFFKRFFDIFISFFAIIIFSPLILLVALLVRIKLGKGVIFSQYRPGKNNKIFKLYKFRTMTNAKNEKGELLPDKDRKSKFGNMLRKTSLDELPQLFNILKGDMSIIGPRPKLVKDMVYYSDEQNVRSLVRPGLTGLAQVNGRNNATWEEIFEYDKQYVQKISFWLDFKIFFKTIGKVFKKADIVEQDQTKQNYYYGDYLLETNQITKEEYDEKQQEAKELIKKAS